MQNALITGGSSGMGLEYARQLAAQGYSLTIVSNRQDQLDSAVPELERVNPDITVTSHWADLAADNAAADLRSWCLEQALMPDVLVCNAGMFFFEELSEGNLKKYDTMLGLHVRANTELCILFGEEMKRRRSGRIVIVSSMAAKLPTPGIALYSATKAYLLSFGKSLWFEMKPYGVKVTTVCPAAIATPLYNLKPSLMKFGTNIGVIHTPKWLVRRALRASEHGRRVIRPSFMNVYLPVLVALLPAPLELKLWDKFNRK